MVVITPAHLKKAGSVYERHPLSVLSLSHDYNLILMVVPYDLIFKTFLEMDVMVRLTMVSLQG